MSSSESLAMVVKCRDEEMEADFRYILEVKETLID